MFDRKDILSKNFDDRQSSKAVIFGYGVWYTLSDNVISHDTIIHQVDNRFLLFAYNDSSKIEGLANEKLYLNRLGPAD